MAQRVQSVSDLFADAIDWNREDGWGDWSAAAELQRVGTQEVLDHALRLLTCDDPRVRARALDVLGQLGSPGRTFPDICAQAAIAALEREDSPRVLQAAAVALGHLNLKDSRTVASLVKRASHSDPSVRHAVAFALGGASDPVAISTLISLTQDENAEVRDWACFGLGSLTDVNTLQIREALFQRLDDEDDGVRYEVLCGLARRGDVRVAKRLATSIKTKADDQSLLEAAKALLRLNDEENLTANQLTERLTAL